MKQPRLRVAGLELQVGAKPVLRGVNLEIGSGEVYVLMGPNGSGKSTLAMSLMGGREQAEVEFEGKELFLMSADERARAGLYVGWQNPVAIPGVSVFNLCKASFEARGGKIESVVEFKKELEILAEKVGLSKEHVARSVNAGFSGGEKKRLELLQMLLFKPKLAILDEIDSGLDAKGIEILAKIINEGKKKGQSFLLITHNTKLLEKVAINGVWEIDDGRLQARV